MFENEIKQAKKTIDDLHTYCFCSQSTFKAQGFNFVQNDFTNITGLIDKQQVIIEYMQKQYIPEIARATKRTDELAFEEMKENARLQAKVERYKHSIKLLEKDVAGAKSEAAKELGKRLKTEFRHEQNYDNLVNLTLKIVRNTIDRFVKEMTEGKE